MVLACVGIFLLASTPSSAQGWMGYANFSFNGTTICADENGWNPLGSRYPDSLGSHVAWGTGLFRTGDDTTGFGMSNGWTGPFCIATTSSNDKYNSKTWSPAIDLSAYQASIAGDPKAATYLFWSFGMEPGWFITPVAGAPDIYIHFLGKRNGSGPDQGYIEVQLYDANGVGTGWITMTGMNSWYVGDVWKITNSAEKEFRFSYEGIPVDTYVRAEFRMHMFNQGSAGGQGDGFQIEGLVTIGPDTPTPVQLVSFSSALNGASVDLKWKTATEINNYGFEVQRSLDADSWDAIGFVEGHGTVNTPQDYSYSDPLTPELRGAPLVYYRLRQIDRDGTEQYSPVVMANTQAVARTVQLFQNYPNPFNPDTRIAFSLNQKQPVSLVIYDVLGNEVERIYDNAAFEAGFHVVSFTGKALTSGTYLYTLITPEGRFSRTMQIAK